MARSELSMGPILFHWPEEMKRDFWFKVADEADIDVAYIGEVVCSKRTPFFDHHLPEIADRLTRAGKKVVWSTMGEVMSKHDRNVVKSFCDIEEAEVEANDVSALYHLSGRGHRIGQYLNVYSEETMRVLAQKGATHFCLPVELPLETIQSLSAAAARLSVSCEVQIFGRVSLALSARCYHARAHGKTKSNCMFVCEKDQDGLELKTHSGKPFLAINGIQTISDRYMVLSEELKSLVEAGIGTFRLSPHSMDMIAITKAYRNLLNGDIDQQEFEQHLKNGEVPQPWMNGFIHGKPGFSHVTRSLE